MKSYLSTRTFPCQRPSIRSFLFLSRTDLLLLPLTISLLCTFLFRSSFPLSLTVLQATPSLVLHALPRVTTVIPYRFILHASTSSTTACRMDIPKEERRLQSALGISVLYRSLSSHTLLAVLLVPRLPYLPRPLSSGLASAVHYHLKIQRLTGLNIVSHL